MNPSDYSQYKSKRDLESNHGFKDRDDEGAKYIQVIGNKVSATLNHEVISFGKIFSNTYAISYSALLPSGIPAVLRFPNGSSMEIKQYPERTLIEGELLEGVGVIRFYAVAKCEVSHLDTTLIVGADDDYYYYSGRFKVVGIECLIDSDFPYSSVSPSSSPLPEINYRPLGSIILNHEDPV